MADRAIATSLTVDASGARVGTDEYIRQMDRAKAKHQETVRLLGESSQGVSRLITDYQRLAASIDPVSQAQFRLAQEYQRSSNLIDRAVKQGVASEQEAARIRTAIANKHIEELNRVKQARLSANAGNDNRMGGGMGSSIQAMYQFQDIGMMAFSGQNAGVLALQQGTQLAGLFKQLQSEGKGVGATLAGAFQGLLSPMSLITVGVTALVALGIQWGMEWLTAGEEVARSLEDQAALSDKLTEKYGQQLEVVKRLNDERKRAEGNADIDLGVRESEIETRRKFMMDRIGQVRSLIPAYGQMGPNGQVIDPSLIDGAGEAVDEFQRQAANGELHGGSFYEVLQAITAAFAGMPDEIAKAAGELKIIEQAFDDVSAAIRRQQGAAAILKNQDYYVNFKGGTTVEAARVQAEADARDNAARQAYTERQRREYSRRTSPDVFGTNIPVPEVKSGLGRDEDRAEFSAGIDRAAKAREQEAQSIIRQAEATEKLLQSQADRQEMAELELASFGMTDAARQRLIDQLKIEQDLRQRGKELTADEASRYRESATAASEAAIKLRELNKQQQAVNQQQEFFVGLGEDLFSGAIAGADGFKDALKRVGLAIADAMFKAAMFGQGPLAQMFGFQPPEGFSVGGIAGQLMGNYSKAANRAAAPANDNSNIIPFPGSGWGGLRQVGAVDAMTTGAVGRGAGGNIAQYIAAQAPKYGIDPAAAIALAKAEGGLSNPFRQAEAMLSYGREQSYGPLQLHVRGGMGADAIRAGIDPRTDWRGGIDYGLMRAQREGWGAWMGAKNAGLGKWTGIDRSAPMGPGAQAGGFSGGATEAGLRELTSSTKQVAQSMTQTAAATGGMGKIAEQAGGGISSMADALKQFPAAPGAPQNGGGSWFQGMFGGGGGLPSAAFGSALSPSAWSWIAGGGGMTGLWAKGGAFPDGIDGFSNSIVDRPTVFAFARGAGIMGEAGPEAIMPLSRGADGKLGVRAGGGGGGMNVTIINNTGANIKTKQKDGGRGLEVAVEERVADRMARSGTPINKAARMAANPPMKRRF